MFYKVEPECVVIKKGTASYFLYINILFKFKPGLISHNCNVNNTIKPGTEKFNKGGYSYVKQQKAK